MYNYFHVVKIEKMILKVQKHVLEMTANCIILQLVFV